MDEYQGPEPSETQLIEEARSKRKSLTGLFLGIGLGGMLLNWLFAHALGWFMEELAVLAPAFLFIGLYFLLFPKLFYAHYQGKANLLIILVMLISLIIGFGNYYALNHGLY
jgi:hypothetical protein